MFDYNQSQKKKRMNVVVPDSPRFLLVVPRTGKSINYNCIFLSCLVDTTARGSFSYLGILLLLIAIIILSCLPFQIVEAKEKRKKKNTSPTHMVRHGSFRCHRSIHCT